MSTFLYTMSGRVDSMMTSSERAKEPNGESSCTKMFKLFVAGPSVTRIAKVTFQIGAKWHEI